MGHWNVAPNLNPNLQYRQKSSSSSSMSMSRTSSKHSGSDKNASQHSSISDDLTNALNVINLNASQKRDRNSSKSPKGSKKFRAP